MKEIKNRWSEMLNLLLFNMFALSFIFVFGGKNFSIDSYGILQSEYIGHIEAFIGSYRFFGAGIFKLLILFGHDPIRNATPAVCFYIVIVSVVTTWLAKQLFDVIGNKSWLVVDLSLLISIVNCWYCDILSFPECVVITGIGTALVFIAIGLIAGDGIKKTLNCMLSVVCLVCATGVYQQYLALFAVYVIALCCVCVQKKEDGKLKENIAIFSKSTLLWVFSGCAYFIIAKIVCSISGVRPNDRIANNISDMVQNALHIIRNLHSYIKGRGFYESEILTICFLITFSLFVLNLICNAIKNGNMTVLGLLLLATSIAGVCSLIVAFLTCNRGYRAMFPFFAMYGFVALVIPESRKKITERALYAILVAVVLLNIGKSVECEFIQKKINAADEMWAKSVVAEIESYEQKTGIEVQKVFVCNDEVCDIVDRGLSSTRVDYALRAMLWLNSEGKEFVIKSTPEIYENVFDSKNWTAYIPSEQIVFVDDTAYICGY